MRRYLALLFFLLYSFNSYASTNPYLTLKQQEIIEIVLGTGTLLTREMHTEFWAEVPKDIDLTSPSFKGTYNNYIEDIAGLSLKYQRELWTSALNSIRAGRVVKTPNYEKTFQELYYSGKIPKEFDVSEFAAKGERYLQAAANRSPIELKGQKVFVTEELVQSALSRIDSGLANAKRLLNPVWTDEEHEYIYSASKLKILSDSPFQESSQELQANGVTVTIRSLQKMVSENLFIGYNTAFYPRSIKANIDGALIGSIAEVERMYRLTPSPRVFTSWRGYKTLTSSYTFRDGADDMYLSIHASFIPEWNGMFQVITVSMNESAAGEVLLEQSLFRTQILR
ncbi:MULTISPECIES: hypothetical protein [unclassified Marinobacterium]|uniref:hypothetical protein n=1 Tax=unclassified Marinobacterium TaxID=2644139 RepID=UPI0015688E1A|nr:MULTISPECIES: hypothetical protein [unclassified Marinobacterium]NRP10102.1 hypothetical protein [Marinobacterium sp. xm-g-48]NRP82947.1 hypothetical protein [Marinobacterium sp. xm-d-509]